MKDKYIISLDQGTTSSRAVLFDHSANIIAAEQKEFTQHFPKAGWVEHDAEEIWDSQFGVLKKLVAKHMLRPEDIAAIGITNQRETTVIWDKKTGKPIHNAIVWQDRRTAAICETLKQQGLEKEISEKTGLVIDAYFSATKIKWLLDNVEGARQKAEAGQLLFGTIDSWLIWNLTEGQVHATDYSNASRTMLFNINTGKWDTALLKALDIPDKILPEVRNSSGAFGSVSFQNKHIKISGVAGDQQAALFGQTCFQTGEAKNTYGTGCFMLMNTGEQKINSKHGLLTTIAWGLDGKITYALEGSVFIAGAAIQWLRDKLEIINDASETEELANNANDNSVVVVPAFAGLGAPHWDMYARGAIFGLTRDTGKAEITKATLQSLAYQTADVLTAMQQDSGISLTSLKVDGGAIANNFLAQFQADILNIEVQRAKVIESTALGAAYLAGLAVNYWSLDEIQQNKQPDRIFMPNMNDKQRKKLQKRWQNAIQRCKHWEDE